MIDTNKYEGHKNDCGYLTLHNIWLKAYCEAVTPNIMLLPFGIRKHITNQLDAFAYKLGDIIKEHTNRFSESVSKQLEELE